MSAEHTGLTTTTDSLDHYAVLLSASLPDDLKGTPAADSLYGLLVVLVGGILRRGGIVVFGGHPSVTPLVHRVATRAQVRPEQIRLHQLRRFEKTAPPVIWDRNVFGEILWTGNADAGPNTLSSDLESMRTSMAEDAEAAVFVGGKVEGFLGQRPGIIDEFERFRRRRPQGAAYLLGALAGATSELIRDRAEEANTLNHVE